MNNVKKGNAFEEKVFKFIKNELSLDRLHVTNKRSKIYQKKGYYSKDRQSNIITDISIETFLPEAPEYSLLTVFECKDYNSPIPVDDIEEFHSKIQQIAGDNVKAIFVTTAALQKSALNYAKSKKIGVMRFFSDDKIGQVLFCEPPRLSKEAFLYQDYVDYFNHGFHTYYDGHIWPGKISLLILTELFKEKEIPLEFYFLD